MLDTLVHGHEFVSAVDKRDSQSMEENCVSMDDMKEFIDHGLDGLMQLVEVYENKLSDLVLDLVPYLAKFHNDYDPSKHSCIVDKLKSSCSNKELVLVASEQLSLTSCPYSYSLLLPLFDLSLPHNSGWLGTTLLNNAVEGVVCDKCSENPPDVSYNAAVVNCLSYLDTSLCSKENIEAFERLMLYVVDVDRSVLSDSNSERVYEILGKLDLDMSSILTGGAAGEEWDPRSVIICSYFPDRVPLVYTMSWLFSSVLPWLLLILADTGNFVEGDDVRPVLDTTMFFSSQHFTVLSVDFDRLKSLFNALISIAIKNTAALNRQDASKSIRLLSAKLSIADRLKLIKHYTGHENSSVAGLFIDMLKYTIARSGREISTQLILKIIRPLLNLQKIDVLENSDKLLATLSLIQLTCTSSAIKQRVTDIRVQFNQFTECVESLVKLKQKEVNTGIMKLEDSPESSAENNVPATICVQGELISEPSGPEQLQSLQLARCRLDLILFNIARTREALDSFES